MRKLLTKILSVIVAVTATLGLIMLPKTSVLASEEFTFGTVAGASVKIGELNETGLRYTIEVNPTFYQGLVDNNDSVVFGAVITTNDYSTTAGDNPDFLDDMIADVRFIDDVSKFATPEELEEINYSSENYVYFASVTYKFDESWEQEVLDKFASKYPNNSSEEIIESAKVQALLTELVCKPYYIINGEPAVFAEWSDARSMSKVANSAILTDGIEYSKEFIAKYLGVVTESNSTVYVDSEGSVFGLSQTDVDAITGAEITNHGNAGVVDGFAIENGKINDLKFLDGKEIGNSYYLSAFKGKDVYRIKYTYVTLGIDEAKDFEALILNKDNSTIHNKGYYILTKDIDEVYTLPDHRYVNGAIYPASLDLGFGGTFDGLGHVISNLKLGSSGLFGKVYCGTIKNVAFKNITISGSYPAVIANQITWDKKTDSHLENIYIEGTNAPSGNVGIIAQNNIYAEVSNVVVNHTLPEGEKTNILNAKQHGVIATQYNYANEKGMTAKLKDFYVIGDLPLAIQFEVKNNPARNNFVFAGNMLKLKTGSETEYELIDKNAFSFLDKVLNHTFTIDGVNYKYSHTICPNASTVWDLDYISTVKQYIDYSSMAKDAEDNKESFATFSDKYWVKVNGALYWKSLYTNYVDVVVTEGENPVDINDITVSNNKTELTVNLVDATQTISNVTITGEDQVGGMNLSVNGNKIKLASMPKEDGSINVIVSATIEGIDVKKQFTINYTNKIITKGDVLYSKDDLALDLPSLKKALSSVGASINSLEEIDGYIVNNETVDTLDLAVTITGAGASRKVDTKQEVIIIIGDVNYIINVYAYTKLIDEASDLTYFGQGATETNGYFLLTKNLTETYSLAAPKDPATSKDACFTGVFDGNGYTISNVTYNSRGIFYRTKDALIKNTAFTNVNLIGYYPCLFGQVENGATVIKDVFVEIDSINVRGSGLYQQTLSRTAKHINVVVEYGITQAEVETLLKTSGNQGSRSTFGGNKSTYTYKEQFQNCFSISYAPVGNTEPQSNNVNWSAFMLAENQYVLGEANADGTIPVIGVSDWDKKMLSLINVANVVRTSSAVAVDCLKGIKAYTDYDAMSKDYTINEDGEKVYNNAAMLATFSNTYWTVSNGVPSWKHKHAYDIKVASPTCEDKGYTTFTCDCGYSYNDNYISELGHNYGEPVYAGNSTHTQTCLNDSEHVLVENCRGGEATETQRAVCDVCKHEYGDLLNHTHNHVKTVVEPTCVSKGYTTYECFCGDIYTTDYVDIDASKHNYSDWLYDNHLGHYKVCSHDETHVIYATNAFSDKVLYSADDKELELLSLRRALDEVDVEISSLDEIEGYIVNGERVDTLELAVTITGTNLAREVSTAQSIVIIVNGQEIALNNVYAYTKVIDEATDLEYFIYNVPENGVKLHNGYYILAKDIDASDYVSSAHIFTNGATHYPNADDQAGGFRGVLDGNGYTISNYTSPSNGIFVVIYNAVIKNIAFENAIVGTRSLNSSVYGGIFANLINGNASNKTFFKNVYIKVTKMINTKDTNYGTLHCGGIFTRNNVNPNAIEFNNVLVDWSDFNEDNLNYIIKPNGNFSTLASLAYNPGGYPNMYKNTYLISSAPLSLRREASAISVFSVAENRVTVTDGVVTTTDKTTLAILGEYPNYNLSTANIAKGAKSYDTIADMENDATNNASSIATFDSNYWIIENGVPYWKSSYYGNDIHEYTENIVRSEAIKTPATCDKKAVYYKSCKCGAIGKTETFEYGNTLEHVYDQEIVKEEAVKVKGENGAPSTLYKSCVCGAISDTETFEIKEMLGKNAIVFGDSYSAYIGTLPTDGWYREYYNGTNILNSPDQMWWSLVSQERGVNIIRNDSFSGSTIGYTGYTDSNGVHADNSNSNGSFIVRLEKLIANGYFEENQVDYVFVLGGTNDSWCGAPLGEEMYEGWTKDDLHNVLPAICYFYNRIREVAPNAEIYGLANCLNMKQEVIDAIEHATIAVGGHAVILQDIETQSSHPSALGMQQIKTQVLEVFDRA